MSSFRLFDLNPEQYRAATHPEGALLILAGAGTGKTRVLTARIAWLVAQKVDPASILAVTFTNKAAREMRERVTSMVGSEKARAMTLCTFHSLCVRILRRDASLLGYKENFSIIDASDQLGLVKKIASSIHDREDPINPDIARAMISKAKNLGLTCGSSMTAALDLPVDSGSMPLYSHHQHASSALQHPAHAASYPSSYVDEMPIGISSLFARYQEELRTLNSMDFDDLLLNARRLLTDHDAARAAWQERYRYILIDEFQDTNKLQLDLISQLVGKNLPSQSTAAATGCVAPVLAPSSTLSTLSCSAPSAPCPSSATATLKADSRPVNLCVVGDDDQSIYGWRGAESSNLLEFERYFSNPEIIKLEQNYRSTDLILSAANRLIRHNSRRRGKNLWSDQREGAPIRVLSSGDDEEEATFIADEIMALGLSQESLNTVAILYRMNAQARQFETALRERKIPYRVIGGKSFFDRREIRDVMAYLTALLNPDDDNALLRVLTTPPRGIGKISLQRLLEISSEKKRSLCEVLLDPEERHDFSTKTAAAIAHFAESWGAYRIRLQTPGEEPAALLRELLEEYGYRDDLRKSCKTPPEADAREGNVHALLESMAEYCMKNQREGIQGFLDSMSLQQEKEDEKEDREGVTLITLHAAKGLEFEHVYLVGLEDGLLPHERSKQEGTIEEERRLCYVGITRAKKNLTITYCRTRKKFGGVISCKPSPFLLEIAGEGVEHDSMEEILARPMEEEEVGDAFARMRALLD